MMMLIFYNLLTFAFLYNNNNLLFALQLGCYCKQLESTRALWEHGNAKELNFRAQVPLKVIYVSQDDTMSSCLLKLGEHF